MSLRIPIRPASPKRAPAYWYHPESDCVFVTTDRDAEISAAEQGCDELERWEYDAMGHHIALGTPINQRRPIMTGFGK